jgi:hypothetical protein
MFRHNLQRMDLELYWGKEQFCPADLHNTPRNEKIIQKWEVGGSWNDSLQSF